MKKSKLTKGLVAGFVASIALAGCGSVSKKDNSILTFTNYDGEKVDIVTESMYKSYRENGGVISTFYDKVLEVLIRDYFKKDNPTLPITKTYETIKGLAEEDVKAAKAKATENSKNSGTTYDAEWQAILDGENVEDENELLEKYIYNQEKEVLEDALYADLTKNDNNTLKKEWIEGALPYHIRHVLAKVDSGAADYTRGTISSDQAKRISDLGLALTLSNDTFGGVAQRLSEDEGSAKLYGDVGLVTNKASTSGTFSMVTEFQMAIYVYDILYRGRDAASAQYKSLIGEGATATERADAFNHITKVPYEVFKFLATQENGGYGDVTTSPSKKIVGEGEEAVYPRNILWNKYLNHHDAFLITNEKVGDYKADGTDYVVGTDVAADFDADKESALLTPVGADEEIRPAADGKTGFRPVEDVLDGVLTAKVGAGRYILTDEKANPIFGVRSEYGIHLIVIEKSAFDSNLEDWYQVYSPKQAEYPTEDGVKLTSYVNYAGFDDSTMTQRASAVKDAIKGYDGTYQYKLYERLFVEEKDRFNFEDASAKELVTEINSYINRQSKKNAYDQEEGYDLAWDKYLLKIEEQQEERSKLRRIVPWGCAIGFTSSYTGDLYDVGTGACYYGNKAK